MILPVLWQFGAFLGLFLVHGFLWASLLFFLGGGRGHCAVAYPRKCSLEYPHSYQGQPLLLNDIKTVSIKNQLLYDVPLEIHEKRFYTLKPAEQRFITLPFNEFSSEYSHNLCLTNYEEITAYIPVNVTKYINVYRKNEIKIQAQSDLFSTLTSIHLLKKKNFIYWHQGKLIISDRPTHTPYDALNHRIPYTIPAPLDIHHKLYAQYFCSDASLLDEKMDIWDDFLAQPSGVRTPKRVCEIIVSLTSYPKRLPTTWLAIESLLRQTIKPDRIILNLYAGEFDDKRLPWFLYQQCQRGLEIHWHPDNLKVFLKVIPTMQRYPLACVVAVDDDVIYPPERLQNLIAGHYAYPDAVICSDGRFIQTFRDYVLPVNTWSFSGWKDSSQPEPPRNDIIPEGVFGVLFPPGALHADYSQQEIFFDLCPTDDDVWLYTMLLLQGRSVAKIERREAPLVTIESTQKIGLFKDNYANQFGKLTHYFGDLYKTYQLHRFFDNKVFIADVGMVKSHLSFHEKLYNVMLEGHTIEQNILCPIQLMSGFHKCHDNALWAKLCGKIALHLDQSPRNYKLVIKGHAYSNPLSDKAPVFRITHDACTHDFYQRHVEWPSQENTQNQLEFILFQQQGTIPLTIHSLNGGRPATYDPNSRDKRLLGLQIQEIGLFEIDDKLFHQISYNTFSSLISFHHGFYKPNHHGVWSSTTGDFSLYFPDTEITYHIRLKSTAFINRETKTMTAQLWHDKTVCVSHEFTQRQPQGFLSFIFKPLGVRHHFRLKVQGATRPCDVQFSKDDRLLGVFLNHLEMEPHNSPKDL